MQNIPLPIKWSAIKNYAEYHELTGIMFEDLVYFIGRLDDTYIKHITEKHQNG